MQEKTQQQYLNIAASLIKRYERDTGKDWVDSPMALCEWMTKLSSEWAFATWRLRKSAMIYFMTHNGPAETVHYLKTLKWHKGIAKPDPGSSTKVKKIPKQTSQKKARRISVEDLNTLMDTLQRGCGKNDLLIAKWLFSGLLVGIRPCEWHDAKIVNNSLVLRNAKFNKDRSCGEFRTLNFKPDKLEDLRTVFEFVDDLNNMRLSEEGFYRLYEQCRRRLYNVNKLIWPNRNEAFICFYTTRHQFSANAKKILDLISVAALMGHRSTDTATRNYLHKRYGDNSMIFVEPDPNNKLLVEDKFKKFGHSQNAESKATKS